MALKVDSWSLAQQLKDKDMKIFTQDGSSEPIDEIVEFELETGGRTYYHVQGSQAADPIRTVRTGLTEPPENMKEIRSNTNTSNKENGVEIDQVFNYYPVGDATGGTIRNPLSYCRSYGPC